MLKTDTKTLFELTGYRREDFSVCLGCRICASVCTLNELGLNINPQELLVSIFLGVHRDHPLTKYCTGCMKCTESCPWRIRIPELIRALREVYGVKEDFSRAFRKSIEIFGRVYEPYVFFLAFPYLLRKGYLKFFPRWLEYLRFKLPEFVKDR